MSDIKKHIEVLKEIKQKTGYGCLSGDTNEWNNSLSFAIQVLERLSEENKWGDLKAQIIKEMPDE